MDYVVTCPLRSSAVNKPLVVYNTDLLNRLFIGNTSHYAVYGFRSHVSVAINYLELTHKVYIGLENELLLLSGFPKMKYPWQN